MMYNIIQLTSKVASTRIVQFEDVTLVTHIFVGCAKFTSKLNYLSGSQWQIADATQNLEKHGREKWGTIFPLFLWINFLKNIFIFIIIKY